MALSLVMRFAARIVDGVGVEAYCYSYALIDPTATFSAVQTTWNTWLADLDALIDGQILDASMTAVPALPSGLKSAPTSASRVEQTGVFNFLATGTSNRWGAVIPSLSNKATVISGGKIVLTGGDPAAQFIALLTTGASVLEFTNNTSQPLVSFKDCLITFRKYRNQAIVASRDS